MIKLINAQDPNGVIGLNNVMPWHIKEELAFFKKETMNHSLLMGRKTFEGIGKVLPGRTTYLLTSDVNYTVDDPNVVVINDIKSLINKYRNSEEVLFIAGGQKIYEQFCLDSQELIISVLKNEYEGDAFFPKIDYSEFTLASENEYDEFIVKRFMRKDVNI